MANSKRTSFVRGKRMRATRLDANGNPVYGSEGSVTTKGFITVSYTTNVEDGEDIAQTNADGDQCINETGTPQFTGFEVEAEFCEVDFHLFEMLTGQRLVTDANGNAVGIVESTDVDLNAFAFALELWLGADVKNYDPSTGSEGEFGYVLNPYLSGGVISDLEVTNDAVTFTVGSMTTKNGAKWGAGPYKVELVDGSPARLSTPLRSRDHRLTQVVEVAPPKVYEGAIPLLDPSGTEPTEATVTGGSGANEASFTVTGGDGIAFWDFGDGHWGESETGDITHTYEMEGTYTATVYQGGGSSSVEVVVPFP